MSEQTKPAPQEMGQLTEQELQTIAQLRTAANQLLGTLGQLEIRKSRVVALLERNEVQAQQILSEARKRSGVSDDMPWQIQEDGKILAIPTNTPEG